MFSFSIIPACPSYEKTLILLCFQKYRYLTSSFVVEQINVTVKGNPEDSAETARDLGEEITDELERILRYKGWL